jgi:hypothetical protein
MIKHIVLGSLLGMLPLAILAGSTRTTGHSEQADCWDRYWRRDGRMTFLTADAPDESQFLCQMLARPGRSPHLLQCIVMTRNELGGIDLSMTTFDGQKFDHDPDFDGVLRFQGQGHTLHVWPKEGDWCSVQNARQDLEWRFEPN